MKIDIENLPSESNILQQIIAELSTENHSLLYEKEDLRTKNHFLLSEIDLLKEQLKILKAKKFGRSSEKLDSQIEQLELWIEENELASAKADIIAEVDIAYPGAASPEAIKITRSLLTERRYCFKSATELSGLWQLGV